MYLLVLIMNDTMLLHCYCTSNARPTDPHPVHKEVHISHKTLGTQINPIGIMATETNRLKAKASTLAAAIARFEGPPWKARLLYTTRYESSLKYSLPITTLCKQYTKPTYQSYSWFTRRQQNVSTRCRPWSTHPRWTRNEK
jgi:hypothetical protein